MPASPLRVGYYSGQDRAYDRRRQAQRVRGLVKLRFGQIIRIPESKTVLGELIGRLQDLTQGRIDPRTERPQLLQIVRRECDLVPGEKSFQRLLDRLLGMKERTADKWRGSRQHKFGLAEVLISLDKPSLRGDDMGWILWHFSR
jgi:hypothetical protein